MTRRAGQQDVVIWPQFQIVGKHLSHDDGIEATGVRSKVCRAGNNPLQRLIAFLFKCGIYALYDDTVCASTRG